MPAFERRQHGIVLFGRFLRLRRPRSISSTARRCLTSAWIQVTTASGMRSNCSVWPVGAVSNDDQIVGRAAVDEQVDHPVEQRHFPQAGRGRGQFDLAMGLANHARAEHPFDVALDVRDVAPRLAFGVDFEAHEPGRELDLGRADRPLEDVGSRVGRDRSRPAARACPAGSPRAQTRTSRWSCPHRPCRRRTPPADRAASSAARKASRSASARCPYADARDGTDRAGRGRPPGDRGSPGSEAPSPP